MNTEKYNKVLNKLEQSSIQGCISGSCYLPGNKDTGEETPDIDIFTYTEPAGTYAVSELLNMGYQYGEASQKGTDAKAEQGKFNKTMWSSISKYGLSTIKLNKDDITVNCTVHKNKKKALDVISNFDMTHVCRGYDIQYDHKLDYSYIYKKEYLDSFTDYDDETKSKMLEDDYVTVPNPHLIKDVDYFNAKRGIRQFNRVTKYWNRGYDTRELARFYIKIIDEVLKQGNIFPNSEKAEELFVNETKDFAEVRSQIYAWLQDKEESD